MANKLDTEKKTTAFAMLREGNSVRSIERMNGGSLAGAVRKIEAPERSRKPPPLFYVYVAIVVAVSI